MLIELLRLFPGYVRFVATGGFPERFINLCRMNDINLWNVENDGVKVEACTLARDYKRIRKPAKRSGMKVKLCKKRGIPFVIKRHKARAGLAFGAVVAVALIGIMSGFVWQVEISGNKTVKSYALTELLREQGVYTGARKSNIDEKDVAKKLMNECAELRWASLNIFGTKVVLEVRETEEKPYVANQKEPVNIVASKDGQIYLAEVYNGTGTVSKNDTVHKGDLLISAIVKNVDETEKTVRASGKIFADTVTENTVSSKLSFTANLRSDCGSRYYLYLFGLKLPLSFGVKGQAEYSDTHYLRGAGTRLPVGVFWENYSNTTETEITLNPKEALYTALRENADFIRNSFSEAQISRVELRESSNKLSVKVKSTIYARENIAVEKPIYIDDSVNFFDEN